MCPEQVPTVWSLCPRGAIQCVRLVRVLPVNRLNQSKFQCLDQEFFPFVLLRVVSGPGT